MLIQYVCKTCGNQIPKLILNPEDVKGVIPCGGCSGFLERIIGGPSSNAVEKIDNGFMTKPVEYDDNRNILRREASDKFFRELHKEEK